MTAALAVAGHMWRRLWHDPLGLAFTFLAPIAVTSVMVGIYTSQDPSEGYPVAVVVDGSAVGEALLTRLEANPVVDVERYHDRAGAERAVRLRDVAAAVVVPRGIDRARGRQPLAVELVGPPEVAAPSGVRAAVEAAVSETAAALQLGRSLLPGGPDAPAATALGAGQLALGQAGGLPDVAPVDRSEWWDPAAAAIVGTLVLFVVMNTMGASSLVAELRQLGVVARLRTTPAPRAALGTGIGLGLMSYALVIAVLGLGAGRLFFGMTWESWPSLAVVVVALALAAGALGLVTGTFLPSVESGTTIAGPAGFTLGMLGGCLWPLDIVGPLLDRIGHLTPHAWAIEALQATGLAGGGLGEVAVQLAVLLAFALVLLLLGAARLARLGAAA